MPKSKEKKIISIPLFIIVLFVMIITILFFSVKAICFSNNNEPKENEIEQVDNNSPEENILLAKIEEQQSEEEENIQEEENIEQQDIAPTPTTKKIKTYTDSNGQNYDSIGIIEIPSLGIKYPILATTSEKLLKVSVTKYWGGNPNEVGNLCISGHNYKNSKFFGNLQNIKNGDVVKITDLEGKTLNYKVYDTYTVEPDDTSCTSQLTNGKIEITLITCYYENGSAHATKRFIVKARV